MSQHTPGPWFVHDFRAASEAPALTDITVSCDHPATITVCSMASALTNTESEALANARLIAAAPDMYEALLSVKAWLEQLRDLHKASENNRTEWPMPGMSARYREVCAALARAEGR